MKKHTIWIVVLLSLIVFTSCKNVEKKAYNYEDITRKNLEIILDDEVELDDLKIRIDYQEPELVYNKTTENQNIDEELCNLTYDLKITNLNNEPIEILAKFFFTEKMFVTFQLSRDSFGTEGGTVTLEPLKGIYIA